MCTNRASSSIQSTVPPQRITLINMKAVTIFRGIKQHALLTKFDFQSYPNGA
jgi:hypothetical protein